VRLISKVYGLPLAVPVTVPNNSNAHQHLELKPINVQKSLTLHLYKKGVKVNFYLVTFLILVWQSVYVAWRRPPGCGQCDRLDQHKQIYPLELCPPHTYSPPNKIYLNQCCGSELILFRIRIWFRIQILRLIFWPEIFLNDAFRCINMYRILKPVIQRKKFSNRITTWKWKK
jgi:hypothetical protein